MNTLATASARGAWTTIIGLAIVLGAFGSGGAAAAVPAEAGHGSSPWPALSSDVPGTDHGDTGTDHGDTGTKHGDTGTEPGDTAGTAPDRPLAVVLGAFGVGTSTVLISAASLRLKDRNRSRAREAARATGRSRI